jgi:hypothetical protein
MRKPHAFAAVLARLRREKGFRSPHAFYRARDGRRSLGLTYPNYLALERGRSLPKPARVPALLRALGVDEGTAPWQELVRSYLTSLLGSDALLRGLAEPAAVLETPTDEIVRGSIRQRAAQLSLEQWRLLAADPAAYYCHVYLINTPGWTLAAEVAREVKFPVARTRAALAALAAAGIVEVAAGRARSPLAYKSLQFLPALPELTHVRMPILRNREAFAGPRGKLAQRRNVSTRMTLAAMERCFRKISDAVALAGVCGNAEKSPDSDVYFVDARVFRIFD